MKESPGDKSIRDDLAEGQWSVEGFLGDDTRTLEQIIRADNVTMQALGVTPQAIAQSMRRLTREGMAGLGDPVETRGFEIEVDEWKGLILCPFKDQRRAAKRQTVVRRLSDKKELRWSDLSIHLIEDHGFFQGIGSSYRIEPQELVEFLGIDGADK